MGAQGDASNWIWNAAINTVADLARIGSDTFRLGSGIGCALFNDQASTSDKAWAVARDVGRGLTLPGAGFGARVAFRAAKGIGKALSKARAPNGLSKLRQAYVDEVAGLANKAKELRNAGHPVEQIARALHAERRALGIKYKKLTPPDKLQQIYARNLKIYKDKFGPSFDLLRGKMNKSFEEIIESATRPGGKDLGF